MITWNSQIHRTPKKIFTLALSLVLYRICSTRYSKLPSVLASNSTIAKNTPNATILLIFTVLNRTKVLYWLKFCCCCCCFWCSVSLELLASCSDPRDTSAWARNPLLTDRRSLGQVCYYRNTADSSDTRQKPQAQRSPLLLVEGGELGRLSFCWWVGGRGPPSAGKNNRPTMGVALYIRWKKNNKEKRTTRSFDRSAAFVRGSLRYVCIYVGWCVEHANHLFPAIYGQ